MAAIASEDYIGALSVTSFTNGVININTNAATQGIDVSGYTGKLAVFISCGAGVSGTVIVPSLKAGPSADSAQALNWVQNITNFSTTASNAVVNVDLRGSNFGSLAASQNKYLFLTYLITGSATANSAIDAVLIGQKKYSA